MEEKRNMQNIILENREKLCLTGVTDVISFDESIITVNTELGLLSVKGYELKLNSLNLDNTELMIEGNIYSLIYTDNYTKGGFMKKLFK